MSLDMLATTAIVVVIVCVAIVSTIGAVVSRRKKKDDAFSLSGRAENDELNPSNTVAGK